MKPGVRALGIAESYRGDRSTIGGAVVRASRVVDGFSFETCTVGGTDATAAIASLYDDLDREDVRYVMVAGVALAWFNVVDLQGIHEHTGRPVLAVTFEESDGLEPVLRQEFSGQALDRRLDAYRSLPDRRPMTVDERRLFVRRVGLSSDEARRVVEAFTPTGGRPEPVRVARQAARAADEYVRRTTDA
ncbi:MAG: DUF99 family protein [Halanaeroarchaeum sp.]